MERLSEIQLKRPSFYRFSRLKAVPKFVLTIALFSNQVVLAGAPAGEGKAANEQAAALQGIENEYRACIIRSKAALTKAESQEIATFRQRLRQQLTPFDGVRVTTQEAAYQQEFIATVKASAPEQIPDKLLSRYQLAMSAEKLRHIVESTLGLSHPSYRKYMQMAEASLYKQDPIDTEAFDRIHKKLLSDLAVSYMYEVDRNVGVTAPLALTMPPDNQFASAVTILNIVSQLVLAVQLENLGLQTDRRQMYLNLSKQMAYAVVGFGAVVGTILIGPGLVARGAYVSGKIAGSVLAGEAVGGMSIGMIGGPGAELFYSSLQTSMSPYFRSLENGTPYSCELQKSVALSDPVGHLKGGLIMGAGFGTAGVVSAHFVPVAALITTAVAIGIGMTYEVGSLAYDGYKAREYFVLAKELEKMTVPAHLKRDKEVLTNIAWREYYNRLDTLTQHFGKALVIATLVKAFTWDGEFKHSLEHFKTAADGGRQTIKGVMAYSSDTIPSVATSTADMAVNGAGSVRRAVQGPSVSARRMSFADQVRAFMERAKVAPAAVQIPLLAVDRQEWEIKKP